MTFLQSPVLGLFLSFSFLCSSFQHYLFVSGGCLVFAFGSEDAIELEISSCTCLADISTVAFHAPLQVNRDQTELPIFRPKLTLRLCFCWHQHALLPQSSSSPPGLSVQHCPSSASARCTYGPQSPGAASAPAFSSAPPSHAPLQPGPSAPLLGCVCGRLAHCDINPCAFLLPFPCSVP